MTVTCAECQTVYDDALCLTYCPHEQFISAEDARRKDEGASLLGKTVRFHGTDPDTAPRFRVQSMNYTGMLSLDQMIGEYAPHLLVAVE